MKNTVGLESAQDNKIKWSLYPVHSVYNDHLHTKQNMQSNIGKHQINIGCAIR